MVLEKQLQERSFNQCELCGSEDALSVYTVPEVKDNGLQTALYACNICIEQLADTEKIKANHWRCLNNSIWSAYDAVKIMSWRMLNRIEAEWTQDLLAAMYLEDELLELAKASGEGEADEDKQLHRDVNGVVLKQGDAVVLVKDLKVKGSSIVAKQGAAVRNIRLDHDNAEYIEGKVDGQNIVIITKYVKKL